MIDGITAVLEEASSHVSPVRVSTEHYGEWWIKDPRDAPTVQPDEYRRVLANEYIVANLGQLIGAPMWESGLIEIPDGLQVPNPAKSPRPDGMISPGIGWASKHQEGREVSSVLRHRDEADNMRRFVGLIALHDWCSGTNPGYLYGAGNLEVYARSCGAFFGGPCWTVDEKRKGEPGMHLLRDTPEGHLPPFAYAGWCRTAERLGLAMAGTGRRFDRDEIDRVSGRLAAVSRADIEQIVDAVPWADVTPIERDELARLLYDRLDMVGARLRLLP